MKWLIEKFKKQWSGFSKVQRVATIVLFGLAACWPWLFLGDPNKPEDPKYPPGWTQPNEAKPVETVQAQSVEPTKELPTVSHRISSSNLLGFDQTVEEYIEDCNLMLGAIWYDKRLTLERETDRGNFLIATLRLGDLESVEVTLMADRISRKIREVSCVLTEGDTQRDRLAARPTIITALMLALEKHPGSYQATGDPAFDWGETSGLYTLHPNKSKVTVRNNIEYALTQGPGYDPTTLTITPVDSQPARASRPPVKPAGTNPRAEMAKFMDPSQTESFSFTSTRFVQNFNRALKTLNRPQERLHEFERLEGGIVGMSLTIEGKSTVGLFDLTVLEHRSGGVGMIICAVSPNLKGFDLKILAAAMASADDPSMPQGDRAKILQKFDPMGFFGDPEDVTMVHGTVIYTYIRQTGGMPVTFMAQPL